MSHTLFVLIAVLTMVQGQAADRAALLWRHGSVTADGSTVRTTAARSAAEVNLPGNGVLRLAGVSAAQTAPMLKLEQGQALISSGQAMLGRRVLEGEIGPVILVLKGTILVSVLAGQPIKITVLEGKATARLKEKRSHFVDLRAGAMLMMGGGDTELAVPTEVRLATLRTTSGLLAPPFGRLPFGQALASAEARQERELEKRRLVASNIRVNGARASVGSPAGENGSRATSGASAPSGGAATGGSSSSSGSSAGSGGGGGTGAFFCVGCASHATPVGAVTANDPNRLAQIRAEKEASSEAGGSTGSVSAGGRVPVSVTVSNGGSRGDLGQAPDAASTVTVSNSTDLNALAQAVILASFGENIAVKDSVFARQPGTINVDAGTIFERTLMLQQSTLTADVIKARGYHVGGRDALVIDGGTFNASQLIRFYGEGGGTLRFRGDVTLNSPLSQLAGRVVQIDAGSRVRTSGAVGVFADEHRYDQPGFGSLEAAGVKSSQSSVGRPRY